MKTRNGKKNVPSTPKNENQSPNVGHAIGNKKIRATSVIQKGKKGRQQHKTVKKAVKMTRENDEPSDNECQAVVQQYGADEKNANAIDEHESHIQQNADEDLKELIQEMRSFREDVLVYAWTNSSRMDVLQEMVGKVVAVSDKLINFMDGMNRRLRKIEQVQLNQQKFETDKWHAFSKFMKFHISLTQEQPQGQPNRARNAGAPLAVAVGVGHRLNIERVRKNLLPLFEEA